MNYSESSSSPSAWQNAKSIFRVTSGNFLEMYDFMVFGYYASAIANTFFPSSNPFASLMLTLMTFGAGFLMRPLGAVILGTYIDQHGRRKGLLITLGLMALGTLTIAVVPGYHTLGIFAPILVLVGRLLQGFSAGVELGGVSVYLSEIAPPGRRGFFVSWQSGSQQISVIFAALLGLGLNHLLGKQAVSDWAWRIPFFIGCMVVPFLFYIRRSLEETEAFREKKHRPGMREIARSVLRNWALVIAGMFMVVTTTVMFYMITAFTPTFGKAVLNMSDQQSFLVTLFVGISNLFWLPLMGALSDRVGRRPLLIIFT
ncbi:citrate-proton symporter, partial [bacteria symbiont BFo2 of Frankliniella occidentalis]